MDESIKKFVISAIERRFLTTRCQARHRNEPFEITRQQFIDMWLTDDRWQNTGRGSDSFVLTRINRSGAWSLDNVKIVTRKQMLEEEHARRREKKSQENQS